ncbi:hypothetical protein [Azospirillum rugosum]|uniref:GNAT superfamily N-acetyltransferase n=1 Tax=Azospirillum rugosum TaxID=416170 RepID=A0ABS4SEQ7_9PROT|nr:hypothetical protein [Azospirillum rugosum]MBP2291060.1 GNAT superfamily N-acetyltransferase [Azospirillum rugosum]MDQ0524876.1 GNAT superfamily N-acetyltransferase [Azospirillum rugosum]
MLTNTFAVESIFNQADDVRQINAARDALMRKLAARGVSLAVCDDWSELQRLNETNRNSWFELLPRPSSSPAFWIAATDATGEVVATQGVVLLDCSKVSFGERLGDLTAFHDAGRAPVGEWCFCASEAAFDTTGRVAFVVAGWVRPDWRGKGLFHPMAALMRLAAWARWDVHWWAGLVDPETVPVWNAKGAGRRRLEPRPTIMYQQNGVGRLPLHLLRFSRPAMVSEAAQMTGGFTRAA